MEFYDTSRQLNHREAADELYRYAQHIRDGLKPECLPKDAEDILGSTERDRLQGFFRARLSNRRIEAYETKMAEEAFRSITDDQRSETDRL